MRNICANCKFAVPVDSPRTAEEWLERADTLAIQCDKMEAELNKPEKGFWNWLGPPEMYPEDRWSGVRKTRSRQFEALAMAASIKDNMECRRYPDAKIVKKMYCCGEFHEILFR